MEEQKKQVENFCNTGYVIRLGTDQYFREIRNRRIITAKICEYSCAATPQIRQTGNRLSGLAETAYASLLAQCFV